MTERSLDLGYIAKDVQTQLNQSRALIEEARRLQGLVPQISDTKIRSQIEETIGNLLRAADTLTANASSTSTHTTTTIVSSTGHR